MAQGIPLQPGDTVTVALLSLCAGGLLQTWTGPGQAQLWSVPEGDGFRSVQGTGIIGRSPRSPGRFREVGLLSVDTGTLLIQPRFPRRKDEDSLQFEGRALRLSRAQGVTAAPRDDVRSLLKQSIGHCLDSGEFLVVEKGSWDAPTEPFCLFIVLPDGDGSISVVETAPAPRASAVWQPHIVAGQNRTSVGAPVSPTSIEAAPSLMMEAIDSWGLHPWDLALTFGSRARD